MAKRYDPDLKILPGTEHTETVGRGLFSRGHEITTYTWSFSCNLCRHKVALANMTSDQAQGYIGVHALKHVEKPEKKKSKNSNDTQPLSRQYGGKNESKGFHFHIWQCDHNGSTLKVHDDPNCTIEFACPVCGRKTR
jgi:hypothetical protein